MGEYKNFAPQWRKDLAEKIRIKLDTLEQYEEKSIDIDYYNFNQFLEGCQSVWCVPPAEEKYGNIKLSKQKLFGTAGQVDNALTQGIKRRNIDIKDVPLIPIIEYKLVPTGTVEYYDASLTSNQRKCKRYRINN